MQALLAKIFRSPPVRISGMEKISRHSQYQNGQSEYKHDGPSFWGASSFGPSGPGKSKPPDKLELTFLIGGC
jgi:hypothetical protein